MKRKLVRPLGIGSDGLQVLPAPDRCQPWNMLRKPGKMAIFIVIAG